MLTSAFAALALFAASETPQPTATTDAQPAKSAEAKASGKTCYTATPSGSRMPRKVCVTNTPKGQDKSEKDLKAEPKPE